MGGDRRLPRGRRTPCGGLVGEYISRGGGGELHKNKQQSLREEGVTYGGVKRRRRHILGKLWVKSCGKQGVGDGERGTHSRSRG